MKTIYFVDVENLGATVTGTLLLRYMEEPDVDFVFAMSSEECEIRDYLERICESKPDSSLVISPQVKDGSDLCLVVEASKYIGKRREVKLVFVSDDKIFKSAAAVLSSTYGLNTKTLSRGHVESMWKAKVDKIFGGN